MEAHLLGQQGETHFLHIQCRKCQHSILALVLVNQVGASSVGLLTDLSYDDVVQTKGRSPVMVDDVIEAHGLFGSPCWDKELGRASQQRVHHLRERLQKREKEKKEQQNTATR